MSEFSLNPTTSTQVSSVDVRAGVSNKGTERSVSFTVTWWPGENYKEVACSWSIDSTAARGGRILACTYAGYPSWYCQLDTIVEVDQANAVTEMMRAIISIPLESAMRKDRSSAK